VVVCLFTNNTVVKVSYFKRTVSYVEITN